MIEILPPLFMITVYDCCLRLMFTIAVYPVAFLLRLSEATDLNLSVIPCVDILPCYIFVEAVT